MKRRVCVIWLIAALFLTSCTFSKPPVLTKEAADDDTDSDTDAPAAREVEGEFCYHDILKDRSIYPNQQDQTTHFCFFDGMIYFVRNGGIFFYDVRSGCVLPACADPGCAHDKIGCISFCTANLLDPTLATKDGGKINSDGTDTIVVAADERAVYFVVHILANGEVLYRYDRKSMTIKKLADSSQISLYGCRFISGEDCLYLTSRILKEGGDSEKPEDYKTAFIALNKLSGKIKVLYYYGDTDSYTPISVNGERVFFTSSDKEKFILGSAALDFSSRSEYCAVDWLWKNCDCGDHVIYSVISEFWDNLTYKACNIYSYDKKSGENKLICGDRAVYYYVSKKYIYYIPRPEEGKEEQGYFVLMRIDHDGGGKKEVMKLSEAMHYILVCGDYFLTYNSQSGKFYCYDLTTGAYSCVNKKENEEAKWYISFGLT